MTVSTFTENSTSHGRESGHSTTHSRWIPFVVCTLMLGLGGLYFADRLFHPQAFHIESIEVYGRLKNVDGNEVRHVVEQSLDGNYFSASLNNLELEIEKLPWVFSASIRRKWPSTLIVDVAEVQPVARWAENKWLNISGDLIEIESSLVSPEHLELPMLYGPDQESEAVWSAFKHWSEVFLVNGLVLNELALDSRGLWKLDVALGALALDSQTSGGAEDTGGVQIIVDKADAAEKLDRFIAALNQQLIQEFSRMEKVDLRYANGFSISWKQELASEALLSDSNFGSETISTIE